MAEITNDIGADVRLNTPSDCQLRKLKASRKRPKQARYTVPGETFISHYRHFALYIPQTDYRSNEQGVSPLYYVYPPGKKAKPIIPEQFDQLAAKDFDALLPGGERVSRRGDSVFFHSPQQNRNRYDKKAAPLILGESRRTSARTSGDFN